MDYSRLDPFRRQASAQELDLVEAYAAGRISRRTFMKRATILGLSLPTISMLIAACGTPAASGTAAAPSTDASAGASAPPASASAGAAGGTIRIATQRPVRIDPVTMEDLSGYGLVAQSFEFLAALDPATGDIGPGLATEWAPNDDNSVWTFTLREGVKWQNGADFTADDVIGTMGRLVEAGNAGLKGVIDENSTKAIDPLTVEFTLLSANGNFPYLVSVFNAQAVITPKDYATGTTLDGMPDGTGAWKLESYDPSTGARYVRNDAWWGGTTPLDAVEWTFFDETGPMVAAYQGGQIDAIVQFDVFSGTALFADANFQVNEAKTTNHRQIWMRTDTGQFVDKRVRQAVALSLDREAMVQQLFQGRGEVANDHVIFSLYPYFDPSSPPQRTRDVERAKALLTEAGVSGLTATLHAAELQEIPDLAVLIQSQAAEAGITLTPAIEALSSFYGAQWCPEGGDPPCSGAAELGIVDYGHRSTPDVFLNSALKTNGAWNSSQYSSAEFDAAFAEFQAAVGVDAQKAACTKIQTILNEDVAVAIPYVYSFLSGNAKTFTGVYSSALGQMFVSSASKVG